MNDLPDGFAEKGFLLRESAPIVSGCSCRLAWIGGMKSGTQPAAPSVRYVAIVQKPYIRMDVNQRRFGMRQTICIVGSVKR